MTTSMTEARTILKSVCGRGVLKMEALKTSSVCRFLFDLRIQPNGLVMGENYWTLKNYVIIKLVIVLFKWYDLDIAWNDESVCDSVWSRDYHDDTGSRGSPYESLLEMRQQPAYIWVSPTRVGHTEFLWHVPPGVRLVVAWDDGWRNHHLKACIKWAINGLNRPSAHQCSVHVIVPTKRKESCACMQERTIIITSNTRMQI